VVKVSLVSTVCSLTILTHNLAHGKLNQKTTAFIRACLAYCFITIPSIENEFEKLYLYAHAGQIALLSDSLPQADEMFKSAINLIREVPQFVEESRKSKPTNQLVVNYLQYIIAILVAVPGHPSHGPFYLLQALLKVVKVWEWESKSTGRVLVYSNVLSLLAANYQKKLPYCWNEVDSNDVLYGGTQKYLRDIQDLINQILNDIYEELKRLAEYADGLSRAAQAEAIVELIYISLESAQLNNNLIKFISTLLEKFDVFADNKHVLRPLKNLITARSAQNPDYKPLLSCFKLL